MTAYSFAACLAYVIDLGPGEVPVPDIPDPFLGWRQWLAGRGLGLVPIADPAGFSWPGHWIARVSGPDRWVVMFGVPSGLVFDPLGGVSDVQPEAGFAVARLELRDGVAASPDHGPGQVEAIYVAPAAQAAMEAREAVEASPQGLAGDRYAAGAGTFSDPHAVGGALTLIEAEALAAAALPDGATLPPELARRNLITRGIGLNALVGRRFRVGASVECYGQRLCEPCAHWQRLTRAGVLRAFVHRGGLRADIVTPGTIRVGDAVTPIP